MTPGAVVAARMLEALEVHDREEARRVLVDWCRPSPRLSVYDVRQVLEAFGPRGETVYRRDDPDPAGPLPPRGTVRDNLPRCPGCGSPEPDPGEAVPSLDDSTPRCPGCGRPEPDQG